MIVSMYAGLALWKLCTVRNRLESPQRSGSYLGPQEGLNLPSLQHPYLPSLHGDHEDLEEAVRAEMSSSEVDVTLCMFI